MSDKESEDKKEVGEKPAAATTSETLTTAYTTSKDKNYFLGLNFNDPWTLGATTLIATGLGATVAYFLSPAIRQWVDNVRQSVIPPPPPPPPSTTATATVPNLSPEELSKKYYADKIRQQQKEEEQFYESFNKPNTIKRKQRVPEASNYYDQYENDIPIIDDNDIFKVSKRFPSQQQESFFKIRDEELHPFQKQKEQKEEEEEQKQKPMFNVESKRIPEEELSIYTDDKIDVNKLPPEFTNVGNRETPTMIDKTTIMKDNDDYDITNLEMTEEELNNLAKNSG
jgi:hypothetical protein